ncbi:unnamed protein product, partial [Ilex paraguariensis]
MASSPSSVFKQYTGTMINNSWYSIFWLPSVPIAYDMEEVGRQVDFPDDLTVRALTPEEP